MHYAPLIITSILYYYRGSDIRGRLLYAPNIIMIILYSLLTFSAQDKYQRTLADRENVRVRLEKQVVDAKLYGIQGFCKDLLEVRRVIGSSVASRGSSSKDLC